MNIRLIAVHPYGRKTANFIAGIVRTSEGKTQKGRIEIATNNALPHFDYVYPSYAPLNYSMAEGSRVYSCHLDYYSEQMRLAQRSGQLPVLVSGRFHEYSAPFLAAVQQILGIAPEVVSYDTHLDCYANKFTSGSFWRYAILHGLLQGEKLTIIGKAGEPMALVPFYLSYIKDSVVKGAIAFANTAEDNCFDFRKAAIEAASIRKQKVEMASPGDSSDVQMDLMRQVWLDNEAEIIALYYRIISEREWANQAGIRLVCREKQPQEIFFGDRNPLFISFDGDVTKYTNTFGLRAIREHLLQIKMHPLTGMHICELDGPDCTLNASSLASTFNEMLFSSSQHQYES